MTDPVDDRARRARTAVRERTAHMAPDRGLDEVVRRAQRPRTAPVAAVLVLALAAVPIVWWLLGTGGELVEFADAIGGAAGAESPIPLWQQFQAMEIAFAVEDELARR